MATAVKRRDMNREEAAAKVEAIRRGLDDIRELIYDLHDRRGWAALGYDSWVACVQAEFPQSRSHLYRQLQAALIERDLSPMGDERISAHLSPMGDSRIPERQLRPLAAVPKDERREVWAEAQATAPEGRMTAGHVQETVDRRLGKSRVNGTETDDPPDVAAARKAGRIPEGVTVEITEPEDDGPISAHLSPMGDSEPEQSDDEWLAALPLSGQLTDQQLKHFHADALIYRKLEKPRAAFQHHASRVLKGRRLGAYAYRVSRFLRSDHPKHWLRCPALDQGGCGGGGVLPMGECPKCRGRGYWIK